MLCVCACVCARYTVPRRPHGDPVLIAPHTVFPFCERFTGRTTPSAASTNARLQLNSLFIVDVWDAQEIARDFLRFAGTGSGFSML